MIHTWTRKASNLVQTDVSNFWGLGDLLRGSNILFEVCKDLNIEYVLDISHHPLGSVFLPNENEVKAKPEYSVPFHFFKDLEDAKLQIAKMFENSDSVVINSNGCPSWPTESSTEWRDLIQSSLPVTPRIRRSLDTFLPPSNYGVFHFRMGDRSLVRGKGRVLIRALVALFRYGEPDDVIISDSKKFKFAAKLFFPRIKVSDATPVHSGLSENSDFLSQTLHDFFLIAGAIKVKTYSEYAWASGFVVSACRLYDVPMIEIDRKALRKGRYLKAQYKKLLNSWKSFRGNA